MWPFKKKTQLQDLPPKAFETILCIPGIWNSWDELILSIASSSNGKYLATGNILMNTTDERHYKIEFCKRDDRVKQAFSVAGRITGVTDVFLDEIGHHKYVVYILGNTGNLEDARHMAFAAGAILKAGGVGIKIETAGKAFEKSIWLSLLETFEAFNLYQMFVVDSIVDKDGAVYSCGMQNLGYKDTIITGEEFQKSVDLISLFSHYQILESPTIQPIQTFSADTESPKFRITDELTQPSNGHELFENPYGMWRLTKV